MEKRRVVITGLWHGQPPGSDRCRELGRRPEGRCGIGPITQFDASALPCTLAAEVKDFDPSTAIDRREARKVARFAIVCPLPPPKHWRTADWMFLPLRSRPA